MNQEEIRKFAETIIVLIEQNKGFHPRLISNKQIYREITGLQRFSRKRWEKLRPLIKAVNWFKIGNRELVGYDPMLRSRYNVKATDSPNDYHYIAGFQLVIRKEGK